MCGRQHSGLACHVFTPTGHDGSNCHYAWHWIVFGMTCPNKISLNNLQGIWYKFYISYCKMGFQLGSKILKCQFTPKTDHQNAKYEFFDKSADGVSASKTEYVQKNRTIAYAKPKLCCNPIQQKRCYVSLVLQLTLQMMSLILEAITHSSLFVCFVLHVWRASFDFIERFCVSFQSLKQLYWMLVKQFLIW